MSYGRARRPARYLVTRKRGKQRKAVDRGLGEAVPEDILAEGSGPVGRGDTSAITTVEDVVTTDDIATTDDVITPDDIVATTASVDEPSAPSLPPPAEVPADTTATRGSGTARKAVGKKAGGKKPGRKASASKADDSAALDGGSGDPDGASDDDAAARTAPATESDADGASAAAEATAPDLSGASDAAGNARAAAAGNADAAQDAIDADGGVAIDGDVRAAGAATVPAPQDAVDADGQLAVDGEPDEQDAEDGEHGEDDGEIEASAAAAKADGPDGDIEAAGDTDGEDRDDDPAAAFPTSAASMDATQLKHLVEALIFASDRPLTVQRLRQLARVGEVRRLEQALTELADEYRERGLVLQQVSGGYQFRTRTQFSPWVQQLIAGRPVRLSRAQLETLAIIAYRQPITRPEIDDIRGVDSSATLKLLIDRMLIRVLGKREEVGRPMLYGTTKEFLDFFSLGDLRELPTLREYSELTAESRKVMSDRLGISPDGIVGDGEDDDGSGGSSGDGGAGHGGTTGSNGHGSNGHASNGHVANGYGNGHGSHAHG
ncbi:MAG: SMC-Scp complex subunit ScpB, partial [Deltaproteobacteria bacterium]